MVPILNFVVKENTAVHWCVHGLAIMAIMAMPQRCIGAYAIYARKCALSASFRISRIHMAIPRVYHANKVSLVGIQLCYFSVTAAHQVCKIE